MKDGLDEVDQAWFEAPTPGEAPNEGIDALERARLREALQTYEREIAASVDPRRRAALSYESGRIHDELFRDESAAIRAYQRAHRSDPTHQPTIAAVRRLFGRAGQWAMVLRMLDAALRAESAPQPRARLLCEKGDVYLLRFGQFEAARQAYEAAAALVPGEPRAVCGMAEATVAAGGEGEVDALLGLAARVDAAGAAGELRVEAAARLADRDPEAATMLLDEGLTTGIERPGAWGLLARLPSRRRISLPTALERAAAATTKPEDRARLLLEAARRLADVDRASALILGRQATTLDPSSTLAWDFVIDLERQRGDWAALASALASSLTASDLDADRVARWWRLAEIQLSRLGDPDAAVVSLRGLLAIEPGWPPATERLARLLSSQGDWAGVIAVREQALEAITDPHRRADALYRIGLIYERHLEDPEGAIQAFRGVVHARPDFQDARRALGRLFVAGGDWASYAALLEDELDSTQDANIRLYLLTRISEIAETYLDDGVAAVEACRRILAFAPDHILTIRRLGRLLGRQNRWTELLEVNDLELEHLEDTGLRLALLGRSAEICDTLLGDTEQAVAYLERALALAPRYVPAVERLADVHQRAGAWGALAALLRRQLELTTVPSERVALLFRIAELQRDRMGDGDAALRTFVEALEAAPDHLPTLRALRGLYRERRDPHQERLLLGEELLRVTDAARRADLLYRAGVLNQRLSEPDEAIEAWEQALAERPGHRGAAMALLDALATRDQAGAVRALRRRIARDAAPAEALMHWSEVMRGACQARDAGAEAAEACRAILALEPGHMSALLTLVGLQAADEDADGLETTYRSLAAAVETPSLQAAYLARAAGIQATTLDDPEGALHTYRAVLEVEPENPEALDYVERWAARAGEVEALAAVLERRLSVATDPRDRETVLVRAGNTLWRAGRLEDAAHCFEAVLELEPESIVALRALRAIYGDLGQSGAAVRATEAQGRKSLDPQNAVRLLLQAGNAQESDARDAQAALTDYRAALARRPDDAEALAAIRGVTERTGRWGVLAETLVGLASAQPADAEPLLLEAAQLFARRLGQVERAVEVLEQLVEQTGGTVTLLQQLADHQVELEDWDGAVSAYARVIEQTEDADLQRAVSLRIAAIHENKREDMAAARTWLEPLVDEGRADLALLERLARVRAATGDPAGARAALEAALPLAADRPAANRRLRLALAVGADPAEVVAWLRVVSVDARGADAEAVAERLTKACVALRKPNALRVLIEPMVSNASGQRAKRLRRLLVDGAREAGAHPSALRLHIEALIEADPDDVALRRLHVAALGRGLDAPDRLAAAFRWLLNRDPFATDDLRGLRRLSERTDAFDRAYELARLLTALGAGGPDDARLIEASQTRVARWPRRALTEADRRLLWSGGAGEPSALLARLAAADPAVFYPDVGTGDAVEGPLADRARRIGRLIGCEIESVCVAERGAEQLFLRDGVLHLGRPVLAMGSAAQCFILGSGMELAAQGLDWITGWSPTSLAGLIEALASLGAQPPEQGVATPEAREARAASLAARLRSVRETLQPDLDALGARLANEDALQTRATLLNAAHRVGLLSAGGISPAVDALRRLGDTTVSIRRAPGLASLIRWVIGDTYYTLRRRLGLSPGDP